MGIKKSGQGLKLTDKQKKIINITVTSVQIVLVLIAVIFSIIILVNPTSQKIANKGTILMPVLSDSMNGSKKDSFKKGDLIIVRAPKDGSKYDANKLKKGDIVTFENADSQTNNTIRYITHRIVKVLDVNGVTKYETKGDAAPAKDSKPLAVQEIKGIYTGKVKGLGNMIFFLQVPKNFALCIILPLALLFVYNVVMFVLMFAEQKALKAKAAVEADEETKRQQIIAEFLAKEEAQQKGEAQQDDSGDEAGSDDGGSSNGDAGDE